VHSIAALNITKKLVIGYIVDQKDSDYKLHESSVV
jgi:hypothetical protein